MGNDTPTGPSDKGFMLVHRQLQERWREEELKRPSGPPTNAQARKTYDTIVSCLPEKYETTCR